jgi:hypothetical protein
MSNALREYTPAEAAAVSEIAVKAVHNAIDKRILSNRLSRTSGRALTDEDLLRLNSGTVSARSCQQSVASVCSIRLTRTPMQIL